MAGKRSGLIVVLVIVLIGAGLVYKLAVSPQEDNSIMQLSASEQIEAARKTGRPMWVFFRTTSCPYCVEMKEYFDKLKPDYQGKVVFIDVNLDNSENRDLGRDYQIRYVPVTRIYDCSYNLSYEEVGLVPLDTLKSELDRVVEAGEQGG